MNNIFYFKHIYKIGGTEQFLYEIAKAYSDKFDITVMYDTIDPDQLQRLSSLVKCIKRVPGQKYKCKRAFFNFNIDAIDDIESEDNYYAFIAHAIYQSIGYKPPILHPKLNHFFGVSKFAAEKLDEYGKKIGREIKTEVCYDPLTVEPVKPVLHLISAARLRDASKGGDRTKIMIEALDRYCDRTGRHYIWDIYTNGSTVHIDSPNVNIKKGRTDIREYIADADFLITLSNDMETFNYSNNEAWMLNTRTVSTDLTVNKELPIIAGSNLTVALDMSNVDEVIEEMFETKAKKFKYIPPQSEWELHLAEGEPDYDPQNGVYVLKVVKRFYDLKEGCYQNAGNLIRVDRERMTGLMSNKNKLVEVIGVE